MAKFSRARGTISNIIRVFIQDNTSTKGAGLAGLVYNSTNLQIGVIREIGTSMTIYTGANIETITTIGTYQAPSASTKCRFKAVDGTNAPGLYEIHFHDDAGHFGAGDTSKNVQIYVWEITTTALNIAPIPIEIELGVFDMQTAVAKIGDEMALTALHRDYSEAGTAQAGTVNSITLAAGSTYAQNQIRVQKITIYEGTGFGQTRGITGFNATTKVCDVARNWEVTPDNTSKYKINNDFGPKVNPQLEVTVDATAWTALVNSISAIQADLGDPSVDTTTIYSRLLAVMAQLAAMSGGFAAHVNVASSTVISGTPTGAISLMNTDDDSRYIVTADGGTGALEFILKFSPLETMEIPVECHMHVYYNEAVGATNSLKLFGYNFQTAAWEAKQTFTNANSDGTYDVPVNASNSAPSAGTLETVSYAVGDVLLKFLQTNNEIGSTMNLDHITVGFVGNPLTLEAVEGSTILAKEATIAALPAPDNAGIAAIKVKTDTIIWSNITDIRDEALGKWVLDPTGKTLTLYRVDGVTVLKVFNLGDTVGDVPVFISRTPAA